MKIENLRTLIRESIQEYVKEIDEAAENAAMEARISKCDEAIATREAKLTAIAESDHSDLIDGNKVKAIENEIKELKKAKAKFEKQKEKKAAKKAPKTEKEEDVVTDAVTEEAPIDETDIMAEMGEDDPANNPELKAAAEKNDKEYNIMNESFLKMQKLAGVITEAEYNKKKSLIETLFLGDLEKMKKSENSKEYTDKEIEDMSLENAKKLYNSVKKSWDVPANNKLKKQLKAKIEKEDPKFFKQTKK